jgi:phosphosulfolactate phosphohydrolase-like enzyme
MEISIHSLLEVATRATVTVAVIDVFRAFTTAAVALVNGASRIVWLAIRCDLGCDARSASLRSGNRFGDPLAMVNHGSLAPLRQDQSGFALHLPVDQP